MLTEEEKVFSLNKELHRTIKDINNNSECNSNDQKSLELAQIVYSHTKSTFAYQCRVIALIRLGYYNKAIELLDQQSSDIVMLYEKAYCYYRTLELEKALRILDYVKAQHPRYSLRNKLAIYHLQAQIFYIQERYLETIQIYNQLISWNGVDEEIQANMLAIDASLSMSHQIDKLPLINYAVSYESMYNTACMYLGNGQILKAKDLLLKARKLCSQTNLNADEVENDLVVIATQLAYTFQLTGDKCTAMEIYESVLSSGSSDHLAIAIASSNTLSIDHSMDLFQIAKRLKPMHHLSSLTCQMKVFQKQTALLNEAILQYHMRKTSNCIKIIHQQLPGLDDTACLLLVATSSEKNLPKQQDMLMDLVKERPTSIPIHLALIQIQLQSAQPDRALTVLLGLIQTRHNQNTVIPIALSALLIWLLQKTGQTERAYKILDEISDSLLTQCIKSNNHVQETLRLLKQIASFNLKNERHQVAVKQYEFLVRLDPTNPQSMVGLITAYMVTDPRKADKYAATLPKVNIDHLNAEALEHSVPGINVYVRNKMNRESYTRVKKKKKKRNPLLPRSPRDTIKDPERWMPLLERTSGSQHKHNECSKNI